MGVSARRGELAAGVDEAGAKVDGEGGRMGDGGGRGIVREREGVLPGIVDGVEGGIAGVGVRGRRRSAYRNGRGTSKSTTCSLVSYLHVILNAAATKSCQQ